MKTELEIIHTIWDIVRAGSVNEDDPINERLLRSFLSIHRGKKLDDFYAKGFDLPEELFQNIGDVRFTLNDNKQWESGLVPKTIKLNNFGFMVDKDGYPIQVVGSEEFRTCRKHPYNKYQPKVNLLNNRFYLYQGLKMPDVEDELSELNTTVEALDKESILGTIILNCQAVLVNPDDEPGYDFTESPYPCPDQIIEHLINSVNAREFQFFLNTRSDETGDARDNTSSFNTREES